ncbi:maltoporin [Andreprevotia chitinilytica]|uniref:maltoporin n=1 Tax=Andreprevotia chitinilytica TaxID=396808 RepID=UPI0005536BA4|nr:carbohydrate porin [Andreprevotia chitinilytica]
MAHKFRITLIAAAVMLASGATAFAADVDTVLGKISTDGYFRAGWGEAGKGGTQECFGIGWAGKYRLGNECDSYAEIGLSAPVVQQANGALWKVHTMIAADAPNADWGSTSSNVKFAQNYVSLEKFTTDSALSTATLWAGKRYYDRPDIHILDYKYLVADGTGAGIENIDIANVGKFSYAIMRPTPDATGHRTAIENLFKLSDVKAGPGSFTFNLGLTKGHASSDVTNPDTPNGWYLSALYDHPVSDLGWNRVGVQYGKGGNANGNFGQVNMWANSGDSTTQVFDNFTLEPKGTKWTVLGNLLYRKDKAALTGTDNTTFTVGARPQYHFTDIFGLATEVGYTTFQPGVGEKQKLAKATVALTAAAGSGAYARPELRLYYTYAKWNSAARAAMFSGSDVYANSSSGSSFGIQAEAWW